MQRDELVTLVHDVCGQTIGANHLIAAIDNYTSHAWVVVEYPQSDITTISRVIGPFFYHVDEYLIGDDKDKDFPDRVWIEQHKREGYDYEWFVCETPKEVTGEAPSSH